MKSLEGQVFGRLVVLGLYTKDDYNHAYWRCLCFCGKTAIVRGTKLKSGHTRSCGCLRSQLKKKNKQRS